MSSPFANFSDPTTNDGKKLWELATRPLKNTFSGSKTGYALFKAGIRDRVSLCLWDTICTFEIDGEFKDLVDNADLIPVGTVQQAYLDRALIITTGAGAATADRPAISDAEFQQAVLENFQSGMLHRVLVESLEGDLELHVAELRNQGKTHNDGPLLLKLIQDKSRGKAIKQQMKNVRDEIKQLKLSHFKWNVTKFNERLESLIDTLKHNEEEYLDKDIADVVVENYKQVKHRDFNALVLAEITDATRKQQDVDWEGLLTLGDSQYQALKSKGEWGKKTPEEEQLIALNAQVQALQAEAAKLKKTTAPSGNSSGGSSGGSSGNNSNTSGSSKGKNGYEDWQFQNPGKKKTLLKKKTVKGVEKETTYHWCVHHNGGKGMWVVHKPEDCKNKNKSWGTPTLAANQVVLDQEEEEK